MKNFLLLILISFSQLINAQVSFEGVSPSSISGNSFVFEWAEPTGSWSTTIPDFNLPNTFIQDTLELVVDNSWSGNNPAYTVPHPLANEGCLDANGGAHSQPSLAGKIAVVWRGSCSFGLKAALAENNGAVAIVIINHSGDPVGMAGGDSGLFINIPVVMISTTDGQLLLSEMANGPVEVFIGNKTGSSTNDLGSSKDVANISKYGSVPTTFVQNGNNNFDLGLTITNYGSDDNIPVLNQTITGPNGYSYDTTLTFGLLPAAQDTDYTYIPYTETNLPTGDYTINYNLSILNKTDQDSSDNNITSSFSVTNDVLSRARTDQSTGEIIANFYPRIYTLAISSCMHLYEENYPVSSIAEGVYFSVGTDSTPLSSEYFNVSIYEWNDIQSGGWEDYTVNQLNPVLINDYFFANDSLSEKIVYHEFADGNGQPAPFQFLDFQRYLVCIEYQGGTALDISFGYDNYLDYGSNSVYNPDFGSGRLNIDGIPPFNGTQGTWYTGWSSADAPSIGLKFGDSTVPSPPPTGQCVPDNSYLGSPFGIYSTVNDTFYLNVPSSKSYTITTSTDAGFYDPNYSGYVIDSIKLVSVTNLPAGLNYSTNNSNLSLGGVDCINISGVYNNSINSSDSVEFKFVGCVSLFGIAICDTFTTSKLFHFYGGQNPPSPPPAGQIRYIDEVFDSVKVTRRCTICY